MHPNPVFREDDQARALSAAAERSFGILTLAGPGEVLAAHVPFVIDATRLMAHLVRSNPITRLLRDGPQEALMMVSGPDSYISPDLYGVDDQVPTWNYVAVHLRGPVRILSDDTLRPHLDNLSAHMEARLLPKPIWTMDKMSDGVAEKMMRMIVPIEMMVRQTDATFKLNQNKDDAARMRAADHVETNGTGHQRTDLAALMRTGAGS